MMPSHREGGKGLGAISRGMTSSLLDKGNLLRAQQGQSSVVGTQQCLGQRWGLPTFTAGMIRWLCTTAIVPCALERRHDP